MYIVVPIYSIDIRYLLKYFDYLLLAEAGIDITLSIII